MPTTEQLQKMWEAEMEFPQIRREDDPMYISPQNTKHKTDMIREPDVFDSIIHRIDSLIEIVSRQTHYGYWQLCPKCEGQKKVSMPTFLPAGVESFSSYQTEWPCDICKGEGVLVRPEINKEGAI